MRPIIIAVLIAILISACGQSPILTTPSADETNIIATNTLDTPISNPQTSRSITTPTEPIYSVEIYTSTPVNTPIVHVQPTDTLTASITATVKPVSTTISETKPVSVEADATTKTSEKILEDIIFDTAELPDISYFANNKSDRFLVDFEDIIAGHPHVGQRSPKPHNDAQVYFSNSDERWLNASQPSDYPPIYAVADGIVQLPDPPNYPYFNVIDHTNYDPPWWHVGYTIAIRIATHDGYNVNFLYSMEPYVMLHNKPKTYFKDFILVEDNQVVKEGEIIGYMYVSPFSERLHGASSPHIAFSLMRDQAGPWDVYAPAIFAEDVVKRFSELFRNPSEGWNSPSYGNDWSRGRGVPTGMGWMINSAENPFGDFPLDVLMYDGIRDKDLSGVAYLDSTTLGYDEADIIYSNEGNGSTTTEVISLDTNWRAIVASIGGPASFHIVFHEQNGQRKSQMFTVGPEQNFSMSVSPQMSSGSVAFEISDTENWGWAIAIAPADIRLNIPGENIPDGFCPPGCPPLP
jgi:hypothetical protein